MVDLDGVLIMAQKLYGLKMYNTDISGYLKEKWANGIPASSVRTRVMQPEISNILNDKSQFRDQLIQFDYANNEEYLASKEWSLERNKGKYHQSILNEREEEELAEVLHYYTKLAVHVDWKKASLDEILMNVPADVILLTQRDKTAEPIITLAHLCYPNGWAAEDAIGKTFNYFHDDVKRTDDSNVLPSNNKFLEHMIYGNKCYERVGAYSFRETAELDRHPDNVVLENTGDYYVRFERQVILSLPEINSFMFVIHTNFYDVRNDPAFIKEAILNADPNCYPREALRGGLRKDILEHLDAYING